MSREVTLTVIGLLSLAFFAILVRERKWEMLARLERQKNILLAIISHQLRAPVTTIQWYVEMIQGGDFGELSDTLKKPFHRLDSAMVNLVHIVGRLLETSRIEHTGIRTVPVALDLREKIHQVIAAYEDKIEEKKHKVIFEEPSEPVLALLDPLVLRAILGVIIDNAISYTPAGGEIRIGIEEKHRHIVVRIQDTGPGLPKSERVGFFSKHFRKEKARLLLTAGGGIGLYLVQRLIEDIKGKIWFHSEEGAGTTFYVTLPKGRV